MTTEGWFAALDRMPMLCSDRAVSPQPSSSRPRSRFEMCVPDNFTNIELCVINLLETRLNRDKLDKTHIIFLKTTSYL